MRHAHISEVGPRSPCRETVRRCQRREDGRKVAIDRLEDILVDARFPVILRRNESEVRWALFMAIRRVEIVRIQERTHRCITRLAIIIQPSGRDVVENVRPDDGPFDSHADVQTHPNGRRIQRSCGQPYPKLRARKVQWADPRSTRLDRELTAGHSFRDPRRDPLLQVQDSGQSAGNGGIHRIRVDTLTVDDPWIHLDTICDCLNFLGLLSGTHGHQISVGVHTEVEHNQWSRQPRRNQFQTVGQRQFIAVWTWPPFRQDRRPNAGNVDPSEIWCT